VTVADATMLRRQRLMAMLAFSLVAAGLPSARAALADEYQVKAAYLCKFGNYIEWPGMQLEGGEQRFEIGVVASDAVAEELAEAAKGQLVAGRPIAVRRLAPGETMTGPGVVFVARSHAARLGETLNAVKGRPVLTVTETEAAAAVANGSMVNFVVVDDKVRFDVELAAVGRSPLKLSARLLGVARAVKGKAS
jgi:hypothetical protein